ncbi:MAG: helix-turn-helix domain-containing protein [Acidobacteriota bacterium]|nr:MAG: helix-turn-helix domain-containing protein [Acidobacteriota bacterium]
MSRKITAREVAERLGAAVSTINRWCRIGKLPNARKVKTPLGEYWEIPESDLMGVEVKMGRPKKV